MKVILAVLVFCFIFLAADAQSVNYSEVKYYSWIYLKSDPRPYKGVILQTNDSTIQFIGDHQLVKKKAVAPFKSERIPISAIDKIMIRERGSGGKGALFGALIGATAGATIGIIDGDDKCGGSFCIFQLSAGEKAVLIGTAMAIPGAGLGAILGSGKKTIYINGNQSLYFNARHELKSYSLSKD